MAKITYTLRPEAIPPARGDVLESSRSRYLILAARKVKRRKAWDMPSFILTVMLAVEAPAGLEERLDRSAKRRGGAYIYTLLWNKRANRKRFSFEQLMQKGHD